MATSPDKTNLIIKALAEVGGIAILLGREISDLKFSLMTHISAEDREVLGKRQDELFKAMEALIVTLGRLIEDGPK